MKLGSSLLLVPTAAGLLLMLKPAPARGGCRDFGADGLNHANHTRSTRFYGPVIRNWEAYVAESDARSGRTRARILAVQRSLAGQGIYSGPRHGVLATRRAIQRFQGSDGLPATGVIDRTLINALGLDRSLEPRTLR